MNWKAERYSSGEYDCESSAGSWAAHYWTEPNGQEFLGYFATLEEAQAACEAYAASIAPKDTRTE